MYEQDQNVGSHFFAVKRFARRGKCLDDGEGSLLLVSKQSGAGLRRSFRRTRPARAFQTPSLVSVKCFRGKKVLAPDHLGRDEERTCVDLAAVRHRQVAAYVAY